MRKTWAALLLVAFASTSLVCASPAPPPRDPSEPGVDVPTYLTRSADDTPDLLSFPPPPSKGRRARGPAPTDFASRGADHDPAVIEPELDSDRAFEVTTDRFRVVFNQPMRVPRPSGAGSKATEGVDAEASTLKITPAIAGKARWVSGHVLEFVASAPMKLGTRYAIELGDVRTSSGEALPEAWKATMIPRATVAGKILSYVPMAGEHRTIAVYPFSGATVGRAPELEILYDQPIDLALARSLVRLEDEDGKPVALRVDHPKKRSFQGFPADPRFVVIATPVVPLKPGEDYTLSAADRLPTTSGPSIETTSFSVASPLEFVEIDCDGGSVEVCEGSNNDKKLRTSSSQVRVRFTNRIAMSEARLKQAVSVTPPVRNLSAYTYGWDEGYLTLSGGFEPSKTYGVSIAGLRDVFGGRLAAPVTFQIETTPTPASAAMPEGVLTLDEAMSKRFTVATRNADEATISLWAVPSGDAAAFEKALDRVRERALPSEPPSVSISVPVRAQKDKLVETPVNLLDKLSAGSSYLASISVGKAAFGAERVEKSSRSSSSGPPVALLTPGGSKALAVHARSVPGATLVHVARLMGGEPVAGASVELAGAAAGVVTDVSGVAVLPGEASGLLSVRASDAELKLDLRDQGATAKELFPALTSGAEAPSGDLRALVITDRGIYRPGSTLHIKTSLRRAADGRLAPAASAEALVKIVGPTGEDVWSSNLVANDMGGAAASFVIPGDAKLGRHQILVTDPENPDPPLARGIVQVAEFEAPRFAVDVDASASDPSHLRASIRGRYLFGAPMAGAAVKWTVRREPAALPSGPLTDQGLSFRPPAPSWWEEQEVADERERTWSRAGEAVLGPDGTLKLDQAVSMAGAIGPQAFVVEADVTDSSNRHIAGRGSVTAHPASRYAGLRVKSRWVDTGTHVNVDLGVIDTEGKAVVGAAVSARLDRIDWRYVRRRGPGGATRYEWSERRIEAGRCSLKSEASPTPCKLLLPQSGSYKITAEVDGRPGGTASIWSWGYEDEGSTSVMPSRGKTIEIVTDKARYAPGETAKLLVHSPYPEATAILAIEQGGLLTHKTARIKGGAAAFDVALEREHAPHMHAVVTLLPISPKGGTIADYRIGAARVPVSFEGVRLDVAVASGKKTYAPGEEAEITVEVKDNGKPEPKAEIALAVVDEGVLRMTNFHMPDPVQALRPGRALDFRLRDSRKALAELVEQSHVAGDGGEGETVTSTRKNFVETALFRPDLRTDASGRVTVRFRLPDNLTQFRVMAVALDDEGKGASSEGDFTVTKPVMLVPAVPRFAAVGDRFEAAVMLHNNTERAMDLAVSLADHRVSASIPARGHKRVPFPIEVATPGDLRLAFAVQEGSGPVLDAVEARVPVDSPGIDEHPRVEGAFSKSQAIALNVPASVQSRAAAGGEGEFLSIRVGQHLWPELGARLGYLIDYPHGCVEQTTSSTLPLLAARDIFPRIGFTRFGDADLRAKIKAGLERLDLMRTPSGGLAYWPGEDDPNVYGTAYAMRAVVLAERAGIEPPRGLLEGMESYLTSHLLSSSAGPEVQAAIAQSLAELQKLPVSHADALFDRRGEQSVFGAASLAMALAALPNQKERVEALLDAVEAGFEEGGVLRVKPGYHDFYYYGSPERTKAQATIALLRLRPKSRLLPFLVNDLAKATGRYTTQATAYSLLALAQQLATSVEDGASVRALLDGKELPVARDLGFGSREYRVPLAHLRGRKATLALESSGEKAVGFLVSASWRRPSEEAGSPAKTTAENGPDVFRVFTDAKGGPVDLEAVRAGDVLRVGLLVRMPENMAEERAGYVAITDHLPAGFEPVQTDLATVASVPELDSSHPFAQVLRSGGNEASHMELHDDRVNVYFDRVWGDFVAASYVVRAVTPGSFVAPPASAELMYEPASHSYTEPRKVVIQ
ncbi:MAG TPA: alpha-2-macroglobulin family protein [Polyangiaceae bacterium]|nr:alpha-2-macroglobulin family protein [Polyangiaceae bacterium]